MTEEMRALDFSQLDIKYSTREFPPIATTRTPVHASDLAQLLAKLQQGELLRSAPLAMLSDWSVRELVASDDCGRICRRAPRSQTRPEAVNGSSTNDVGLITLPEGRDTSRSPCSSVVQS